MRFNGVGIGMKEATGEKMQCCERGREMSIGTSCCCPVDAASVSAFQRVALILPLPRNAPAKKDDIRRGCMATMCGVTPFKLPRSGQMVFVIVGGGTSLIGLQDSSTIT
jgi:hypothetical protein